MARQTQAFLAVIILSMSLLMLGGAIIDTAKNQQGYWNSFFLYRVRALDDLPYWLISGLVLVAVNGFWMIGLSRIVGRSEFSPFQQNGRVSWNVPVQYMILFGRNLVLICMLLVAYLVMQGIGI